MKLFAAHRPSSLRHSITAAGERRFDRPKLSDEAVSTRRPGNAEGRKARAESASGVHSSLALRAIAQRHVLPTVSLSASEDQLTFGELRHLPSRSAQTLQRLLGRGDTFALVAAANGSSQDDLLVDTLKLKVSLFTRAQALPSEDKPTAASRFEALDSAAFATTRRLNEGVDRLNDLPSNGGVHTLARDVLNRLCSATIDVDDEQRSLLFQSPRRFAQTIREAATFGIAIVVVPKDGVPVPKLLFSDQGYFDEMVASFVHKALVDDFDGDAHRAAGIEIETLRRGTSIPR